MQHIKGPNRSLITDSQRLRFTIWLPRASAPYKVQSRAFCLKPTWLKTPPGNSRCNLYLRVLPPMDYLSHTYTDDMVHIHGITYDIRDKVLPDSLSKFGSCSQSLRRPGQMSNPIIYNLRTGELLLIPK